MAKKKKLSDKQRRFCEEYIIDWNATRAAIAAGYSERTAYSMGNENLKKPEIQEVLNELRTDIAKQAGLSALKVALELKKIAFASPANLRKDWRELKDWEDLTEDEKAAISAIRVNNKFDKDGLHLIEEVNYEMYNKLKALEMLNKQLGFNEPDKQEISINDGEITVNYK
ncbi:terminase small subunit [Limibacter armeniacum]|uniref:terminase small subunit n=1 Tax=Limibacter armeniacum TaxID=466084 RepID=UPI002FE56541